MFIKALSQPRDRRRGHRLRRARTGDRGVRVPDGVRAAGRVLLGALSVPQADHPAPDRRHRRPPGRRPDPHAPRTAAPTSPPGRSARSPRSPAAARTTGGVHSARKARSPAPTPRRPAGTPPTGRTASTRSDPHRRGRRAGTGPRRTPAAVARSGAAPASSATAAARATARAPVARRSGPRTRRARTRRVARRRAASRDRADRGGIAAEQDVMRRARELRDARRELRNRDGRSTA